VVVATTVLLAAACAGEPAPPQTAEQAGVVVASFDFEESQLLAEIYAQALEDEGVVVQRELRLGQRELVLPALRRGLVDVVPEYAGSALDATAPGSATDPSDIVAVTTALRAAVQPWGMSVLAPAPASNRNVLAVPAGFAADRGLRTISDLAPLAPSLTIGGPPECPQRPRCLRGLEDRYGLQFAGFVPLAGADLVRRALDDGVVDVGVLFSTDAALAGVDVVVLEDDLRLQPADNVVPVVRTSALRDSRVTRALSEVSAHLTTTSLRFLNWRLAHAGTGVAAEARGWLVRQGLVAR
jgi:osmoprotectant transport system substrate-binding protein